MTIFELADFFLLLDKVYYSGPLLNCSVQSLYTSALEFLLDSFWCFLSLFFFFFYFFFNFKFYFFFKLYVFCLWIEHLILLMYCFPGFISLSVFSCSSLSSFKIIILSSLLGNLQIFVSLKLVIWALFLFPLINQSHISLIFHDPWRFSLISVQVNKQNLFHSLRTGFGSKDIDQKVQKDFLGL